MGDRWIDRYIVGLKYTCVYMYGYMIVRYRFDLIFTAMFSIMKASYYHLSVINIYLHKDNYDIHVCTVYFYIISALPIYLSDRLSSLVKNGPGPFLGILGDHNFY